MGEIEGWSHMGGGGGGGRLLPNGLLPNAGPLIETLDSERWLKAEERTAELITCIQPNQPSEEQRNAVADYVQRLIMKCFPCQVFTFGSVPLKTYLPDGDIDLTAFSNNPNLKDSWASEVRDLLETEEKNENAEFHVKEVQYIQAEVKIIKCLVENIVVDISFNQLGGLCTLCFLEEVDNLISQNHLFKRSIILIKAWCYYESRILGAHHGLISTYALETLVLYIFHVFNNSFAGPLEVLYRFLEFFSNFDWDNFCVSLWGPVPISSLPDVTAEPPRKDSGELLLNKMFLDACSSVYAVFPGGHDNQGQPFLLKHFNVIDPLRVSNNLGRSVSKGNFFRIRSAFAFGAKRLARLLDCPKENLVTEVNQFFTNTWDRHGNGIRPDAPVINSLSWRTLMDTRMSNSSGKKLEYVGQESDFEGAHSSNHHLETPPKTSVINAVPHTQSQKRNGNLNRLKASDSVMKEAAPKGQHILKSGHLLNDIQRSPFARTRSSPELTDTYKYVPFQGILNKATEIEKNQASSGNHHNRRKNAEPEPPIGQSSGDEHSSLRHAPPHQSFDASVETGIDSNAYHREDMQQEEQDLVNMMASSEFHGVNGQVHMPVNLASGHFPFPFSPSFLASLGYTQRNLAGMVPTNMPLMDPAFSGMHFPHGLVSPQLTHYFSGVMPHSEDPVDPLNDNNLVSAEINSGDDNHDYWDRANTEFVPQYDKPQQSSTGMNYVPPPHRVGGSGGLIRSQPKNNKERRLRDKNLLDHPQNQENKESDTPSDERTMSSRYSSAAHSNSLRSKTSSESSWDEAKSTKEKRGKKKIMPTELSPFDRMQSEDDDPDTNPVSAQAMVPIHVQRSRVPNAEPAQTSGVGSVIPMAPMIIGSNPRQRTMDNSTPLTFYPTGPPVPFLTMLPLYNVPSENGSSDASGSHFGVEEITDNGDDGQSFHPEGFPQSEDFSLRGAIPGETSDEPKSDILNSDFASHWQNLQFGRFCQSPRHHGPNVYHSPVMVPPVYLQGRVPWDGPGRNVNMVTQLMNYGPRFVPMAPLQSVPNRPPNVYQHYVEELPRYRSGTGTYLPNPKVAVRERNSSGPRRGNYNSDRTDNHADREGNWNVNMKSRGSNRNHHRNQTDKSNPRLDRLGSSGSRSDRSMNSQRHDSFSMYQLQNGPSHPSSSQSNANVTYGMYPLPSSNLGGVGSNGSNGPAVMMVYPFEQNTGFSSHNEQLEFGSFPAGFSSASEQSPRGEGSHPRGTLEEQRLYGASAQLSPPDQPLSPRPQRRV